jgi:hypothetical protein
MATGADLPHDPPPRQDPRPRDAIFSEENKNLNYSIRLEKYHWIFILNCVSHLLVLFPAVCDLIFEGFPGQNQFFLEIRKINTSLLRSQNNIRIFPTKI